MLICSDDNIVVHGMTHHEGAMLMFQYIGIVPFSQTPSITKKKTDVIFHLPRINGHHHKTKKRIHRMWFNEYMTENQSPFI